MRGDRFGSSRRPLAPTAKNIRFCIPHGCVPEPRRHQAILSPEVTAIPVLHVYRPYPYCVTVRTRRAHG